MLEDNNLQSTDNSQPTQQQSQQPVQSPVVGSEPTQTSQPTPQSVYPGPSVPANGQMPVGMSASQMGFSQSQSSKNWKPLLKPLIVAVVVLVVLGGGFLFFKGLSGYGTKTVQGDGFTYSVTFSKLSSTTTVNGKPYLQGKDKSGQVMLLYVGKSVQAKYDCHSGAGSTISIVSTPTIDGSQHNLCYSQSLNAYDMNFTHNDTWYFLAVYPKDKSSILDRDTVKTIANSVRVH